MFVNWLLVCNGLSYLDQHFLHFVSFTTVEFPQISSAMLLLASNLEESGVPIQLLEEADFEVWLRCIDALLPQSASSPPLSSVRLCQ